MRSFQALLALAVLSLTAFTPAVASGNTTGTAPDNTLTMRTTAATTATAVKQTPELRSFSQLLGAAGLRHQLNRADRAYTVFAPTTEAVERVPQHIREQLFVSQNPGLRRLLRSYVVPGAVDLTQVPNGTVLKTLSGEPLRVDHQPDGSVLLNGVYRVQAAQATANGRVYTINTMIAPVQQ